MTSTVFLKSGAIESDKGLLQKVNTSATAPLSAPAQQQAAPAMATPPPPPPPANSKK
jgi:hypothetical protein